LKPTSRPGTGGQQIAKRPAVRPETRPAGGHTSAPGFAANRPAQRPGAGGGGTSKIAGKIGDGPGKTGGKIGDGPGKIAGKKGDGPGKIGGRPSSGDVGDFLGVHRPLAPDGERPKIGGNGTQKIGGKFPDKDRPKIGGNGTQKKFPDRIPGKKDDRPIVDRRPNRDGPINIGNEINTNINVQPQWANIDRTKINGIQNNWQGAINNRPQFNNYLANNPNRGNYYRGWGDNVRGHWDNYHDHDAWFNQDWWEDHNHACCGWHYHQSFYDHDWSDWWSTPSWTGLSSWFTGPAASAAAWSQPVYYDYGTGGNVTYQDNSVYLGGQQVASAEDFAKSAAALATVAPPANQEEAEKAEWMPLGTFAVASHQKDADPSRVIQFAVNKQGVISGTLYNKETDQAQTVQGQVDKQTQRVAFRIGDSENIVVETGLYNLTQDEAPVMVHFGADKVENYLLVRLKQSDDGETGKK
jgi:hypothetical protein